MRQIPVFVVHGGAASTQVSDREWSQLMSGIKEACRAGVFILQHGGKAEDAVTEAIRILEEHPLFDAGFGSHLDQRGRVVLDASLMRGEDLSFAGLIGMERCRNPILVARKLLEEQDLMILFGQGAEAYAHQHGFPLIDNRELISEREQKRFEKFQRDGFSGRMTDFLAKRPLSDTVGAIAMDTQGRLVAGNSTGGIPFKVHGRVGDTPLPGCGVLAEDPIGAVCCTGWGEAITKMTLASRVIELLRQGQPPLSAVQRAVKHFRAITKSECGILCINGQGQLGVAFNSPQMPWAAYSPVEEWIDADTHSFKIANLEPSPQHPPSH